jgi:hypothetical protein
MKDPRIGMHYADVHRRLKRLEKNRKQIKDHHGAYAMRESLFRQAGLNEGKKAEKELRKEFN